MINLLLSNMSKSESENMDLINKINQSTKLPNPQAVKTPMRDPNAYVPVGSSIRKQR